MEDALPVRYGTGAYVRLTMSGLLLVEGWVLIVLLSNGDCCICPTYAVGKTCPGALVMLAVTPGWSSPRPVQTSLSRLEGDVDRVSMTWSEPSSSIDTSGKTCLPVLLLYYHRVEPGTCWLDRESWQLLPRQGAKTWWTTACDLCNGRATGWYYEPSHRWLGVRGCHPRCIKSGRDWFPVPSPYGGMERLVRRVEKIRSVEERFWIWLSMEEILSSWPDDTVVHTATLWRPCLRSWHVILVAVTDRWNKLLSPN